MMNIRRQISVSQRLFLLTIVVLFLLCSSEIVKINHYRKDSGKGNTHSITTPYMLLTEQAENRIVIVDVNKNSIIWEWKAEYSNIRAKYYSWFKNLSDVKPVYNNKYLLITASGGGVALIRIADKHVVFYAYAGGNTHSGETLPDGNIVTASSDGNCLTIFKTDTTHFPENVLKIKVPLKFAHNVVWDKKDQLLWSGSMDHLISFRYNFNCKTPELTRQDSILIPGTEAHDVFPVYGKNALWITNTTAIFQYNLTSKKLSKPDFSKNNIKSISSGPDQTPVAIVIPIEKWWTDRVLSSDNKILFQQPGLRIYKARWLLSNNFSYGNSGKIVLCK